MRDKGERESGTVGGDEELKLLIKSIEYIYVSTP